MPARTVFFLFFLLQIPFGLKAQESSLPTIKPLAAPTFKAWLDSLSRQYPVDFYFREEWLNDEVPYVANRPIAGNLATLLDSLLAPAGLTYYLFDASSVILLPQKDWPKNVDRAYLNRKAAAVQDKAFLAEQPLVSIGSERTVTADQPADVNGQLTDAYNGEPLAGAAIVLAEANVQVLTDTDGKFQLKVPTGIYRADLRYLGYEAATIRLDVRASGFWSAKLAPEPRTLNEVLVSDRKDDSNISQTEMGVSRIDAEQINATPSFMGEPDVVQTVLVQAGVSQLGEGAAGFNVRGGGIDQNLVLLDGAPVYNPSHVFGLFSAFNADAIKGATLYKGQMPAQMGGRLSSVLAIDAKESARRFGFSGNVGPVAGKLTLVAPLLDGQTYVLASGRASYADWVLRRLQNPDLQQSSARFHDLHLKVRQNLGKTGSLSVGYYNSSDRFRFSGQFAFDWQNEHLSLQWKQLISPSLSGQLSASRGSYRAGFADPNPVSAEAVATGLDFTYLTQDFFIDAISGHALQAGIAWQVYQGMPMEAQPQPSQPTQGSGQGQEIAVYLSDAFSLSNQLDISVGLRFSFYRQTGPYTQYLFAEGLPKSEATLLDEQNFANGQSVVNYQGLEPRFSMNFQIDGQQAIKLSYNRINQYIHLVSNTAAATPVDFWQISTPNLPPQRVDSFSLGYFRNWSGNRWESSVEAYWRDFNNLVEYRDFADLLLNPLLEAELLQAEGKAYGIEAQVRKRAGRLTGSLGYNFLRSLRRTANAPAADAINNGNWYPANFDQPHQLDMLLNWQMSKRHRLGLVYQFRSGRPVAAPVGNFFLGQVGIPFFSERNQFRIPDYHRLDFSYTFSRNQIRTQRYKGSFTFTLYNLLGRRNAFSVFFRRDRQVPSNAFKLSIIGSAFPTVSYRFQF